MKTKAILLVIAALIMSACDRTKEDKVTEAFKEYVKTDFSDPDDFIEITKIDNADTLNVERALELSTTLDSIKHLFPDNIREKYEYRRKKLIDDDPCVIVHPIKVRMRGEGESKVIRKYWVIEDKGQARVQDHVLQMDEIPDTYLDFLEIVEGMFTLYIKALGLDD